MSSRALAMILAAVVLYPQTALGQKKAARDRNLITQDEIVKSGAKSTSQVVRKLRPMWLSSRGAAGLSTPNASADATYNTREQAVVVYVDGVRRGTATELDDVPLEQVQEIKFYSADDATNRFGMGHDLGAIEVITKK